MAITKSKQDWRVGSTVKIGFINAVVRAWLPTPNDSKPDMYLLTSLDGSKIYKFIPHNGLKLITVEEADELLLAAESVPVQPQQTELNEEAKQKARAAVEHVFKKHKVPA